jgi:hypothetical protein
LIGLSVESQLIVLSGGFSPGHPARYTRRRCPTYTVVDSSVSKQQQAAASSSKQQQAAASSSSKQQQAASRQHVDRAPGLHEARGGRGVMAHMHATSNPAMCNSMLNSIAASPAQKDASFWAPSFALTIVPSLSWQSGRLPL